MPLEPESAMVWGTTAGKCMIIQFFLQGTCDYKIWLKVDALDVNTIPQGSNSVPAWNQPWTKFMMEHYTMYDKSIA
jgi:hypothetical protein